MHTIAFARKLRRDQTDAEAALWQLLRARRLVGRKFRRQHPVGPYVLDFFCAAEALAIELDGGQHFDDARVVAHDERRSQWLSRRGITVLRFATDLMFRDPEGVMEAIFAELERLHLTRRGVAPATSPR